jgi:hypothetical protein
MSLRTGDDHRDRSLGLALFGSAQILIGLASGALVPLTVVAVVVSPLVDLRATVPTMLLATAMAGVFIVLGIGSIRARQWARSLSLSLAWIWLVTGAATVALLWLALPSLWSDLAAASGLDGGTARIIAVGGQLVLLVFYVLLPLAFVLFYRSPDVIATCRARDPSPGWAALCPQPLLALAVAYGLGALSVVTMPAYGFVFPLFGRLLSGRWGAVAWAAVAGLGLLLARATCRREPWAWWTALLATVLATASTILTFARIEPESVFEAMALPPDQRLMLEQLWPSSPWVHGFVWLAIWGSLLAYLLGVRRLFDPPPLERGRSRA